MMNKPNAGSVPMEHFTKALEYLRQRAGVPCVVGCESLT